MYSPGVLKVAVVAAPASTHFKMGVDLRIRQRAVILKLLDADGLVDMPWWHLASEHAFANGLGPGAHVLVRHQRHRSHRIRPMARLAFLLQYGGDILGEGDRRVRRFGARKLRRCK